MSTLVIQLPPRQRLSARGVDVAAGLRLPAELDFVHSADGNRVGQSGRAALSLLPKADSVVLALSDADVSWHRITVPKAPSTRLRAALAGVLEDSLLEDEENLHFALTADTTPGQPGWVAVTHKAWLSAALTTLEQADCRSSGWCLRAHRPARIPNRPVVIFSAMTLTATPPRGWL